MYVSFNRYLHWFFLKSCFLYSRLWIPLNEMFYIDIVPVLFLFKKCKFHLKKLLSYCYHSCQSSWILKLLYFCFIFQLHLYVKAYKDCPIQDTMPYTGRYVMLSFIDFHIIYKVFTMFVKIFWSFSIDLLFFSPPPSATKTWWICTVYGIEHIQCHIIFIYFHIYQKDSLFSVNLNC